VNGICHLKLLLLLCRHNHQGTEPGPAAAPAGRAAGGATAPPPPPHRQRRAAKLAAQGAGACCACLQLCVCSGTSHTAQRRTHSHSTQALTHSLLLPHDSQVRFHPDKVPASAPLAERVRAEEVSKILNSHDWVGGLPGAPR
jgi:hypothetical protein